MISKLLSLLSKDIFLTITPDRVLLESKEVNKSIKTTIHLSLDDKNPKVVGVGDELTTSAANKKVDLFKANNWNESEHKKMELLNAYFKYVVSISQNIRSVIIRPKITVKGSESLEEIFCGYQQSILETVLIEAGAREVVFVE